MRDEEEKRLRLSCYVGVAHCTELLYSAIVKELGEIIGLPSSMCNLHFNEPPLLQLI